LLGTTKLLLVTGVSVLVLSLAACSGGDITSSSSTTTTARQPAEVIETTTTVSSTTTLPITVWQTVRYEESASVLVYKGAWTRSSAPLASNGRFVHTNSSKGSVTFEFVGTYCAWLAKTSDQYGRAKVTLDGQSASTVDLYSKSAVWAHVVWETKTLPFGAHTVTISWTGKKAKASKDTRINVDAIEVVGAMVGRYPQNDKRFVYSGKWSTTQDAKAEGGSFALTKFTGSSVTVNLTGIQVDWFAKVGPAYGKAKVTVDGGDSTMIDLYSDEELWRQRVWSSGRMDMGPHVVKIQWTGTKDPESTGTYINIDGFEIAGVLN
jgi:hypothetical protein